MDKSWTFTLIIITAKVIRFRKLKSGCSEETCFVARVATRLTLLTRRVDLYFNTNNYICSHDTSASTVHVSRYDSNGACAVACFHSIKMAGNNCYSCRPVPDRAAGCSVQCRTKDVSWEQVY